MIFGSTSNTAIFFASGVLVLASVIHQLSSLRRCRFLSRTQALLRSAWERVASFREASTDETGLIVQAKMRELRVEQMRWCFRAIGVFLVPNTVYIMYNITLDVPRSETSRQDVLHILIYGLHLLVSICPGAVSWKTIDGFYGALMLLCALYASPWCCDADAALIVILGTTGLACLLNTVRRSILVSLAFNSMLAMAVLGTLWVYQHTLMARPKTFSVLELLILVLFPAFAYTLDIGIGMGIRNGIEMQATKEILSAASALLRTCCDVVVELDPEGTIISPARELGGFLLRGSCRSYKGSLLSELFSLEDDKQSFLGRLRAPEPNDVGLGEAIHVQMKDGNDQLLRVELMWFGFRHMSGGRRYMVGLREFSDGTQPGKKQPRRRRRRQPRGDGDGPAEGSVPEEGSVSEEGSISDGHEEGSRASRSGSRVTSNTSMSVEVQVASITVDATVEGVPIRGYSPGFRSRIGRLPLGSNLVDSVRHGEDFARWLQAALNCVCSGSRPPDYRGALDLRQGRLEATCRILADEENPLALTRVQLVFFNIRQHRGRSRGPPDAGLRGTPVGRMSL